MAFTIPDLQSITNGSNGYDSQAVSDNTDIAAQIAEAAGTAYVISGLAVTWSSGNTLAVAAGTYCVNGTLYAYAGGTCSGTNGDASDRRDIVCIGTSATPAVTAGTDCGTANWTRTSSNLPPVKPSIPSNSVLLYEATAVASQTAYAAINLVDKRCFGIPDPLAITQYAPSTAGSYSLVAITTGLTALDTTNLKVTFVAPPSGTVRVRLSAMVQGAASAGKNVIFGVVSSTGSPGTLVGISGVALTAATGTALDNQETCSFEEVISGLTAGNSYTWYFAAAYVSTAAKVIPQGGASNTTSVTGGPAVIEVQACR